MPLWRRQRGIPNGWRPGLLATPEGIPNGSRPGLIRNSCGARDGRALRGRSCDAASALDQLDLHRASPVTAGFFRRSVIVLAHLAGVGGRHEAPRVPRDLDDHERDDQPDDGICARQSHCDEGSADDHAERDEGIGSGVVAISDESRAGQSPPGTQPDLRGKLVARPPDCASWRRRSTATSAWSTSRGARAARVTTRGCTAPTRSSSRWSTTSGTGSRR